jgi:hypothetical protein
MSRDYTLRKITHLSLCRKQEVAIDFAGQKKDDAEDVIVKCEKSPSLYGFSCGRA